MLLTQYLYEIVNTTYKIQSSLFLLIWSCIVASAAVSSLKTSAQDVPSLPPASDPSRIQQEVQPPSPPRQTPREIIIPTIEDLAPPGAEQQRFRLESLQIEGATVYPTDRLRSLYSQYLGQEVSLSDLYLIANRITQLYRQDGYILSQAVVPEQTIQAGAARIQVVEGFIERVDIQGAAPAQMQRVQRYVDNVVDSRPLNIRDLERYLLLANDLPGIEVRAVLSPGEAAGASLLTANVTYKQLSAFTDFNNRGSREVGELRAQATLFLNSLLGAGEQFTLNAATTPEDTSELVSGSVGVALPVGDEGLRLSLNGAFTGVRPGEELRRFDINGLTYSASLGATYPLIRSRSRNLLLSSQFDYTDRQVTGLSGADTQFLSQDRLRVLRAGVNYDQSDVAGFTVAGLPVSHGIGGLGATTTNLESRPLSRALGSASFTKVNLNLSRAQYLPAGLTLELSAIGQATGDALLVSEQFGVGGDDFGRAFDPSQVLGDSGYALRAELQRPFFYKVDGLGQMVTQPYIFYDYGQVFRKFTTAAERSSDALSSAGLGVRHSLSNTLLLQGEVASPLVRTDSSADRGTRLFFSLRGFF